MELKKILCGLLLGVATPVHGFPGGYPTRNIGGITVIDTPIVRAAEQYARERSTDELFGHVMRSWLYGVVTIANNETLSSSVDIEVHAVASLLHDLGLDQTPNSTVVSSDRRFEVDGAIAARNFIRSHPDGKHWDEVRVQRVWDAIVLHTQDLIFPYKELDVRVIPPGIVMDFTGPTNGEISDKQYAHVGKLFPKTGFGSGFNDTLIWLCRTKPAATYDTWMEPWGDNYVSNYSSKGHRLFDTILYGPGLEN